MPFDPSLPISGTPLQSAVMRAQFTGLKDLIDAVPTITSAQVDGVTTLPPGDPATVSVSVAGGVLFLTFGIPQGTQGQVGQTGQDGQVGPQGPPFAQAVVDAVNTLPNGSAATVSVSFDGSLVHFTFGIPEGQTGPQGEQGPPGEVTTVELNTGLEAVTNASSANSNAVNTLDTPFAAPDAEVLRTAFNELVLALRRP